MAKSKPSAVISLTGILDRRFKVIADVKAPFGFYLEYKGKKYEPDISLHRVLSDSITEGDVSIFDEDGFSMSGFENIQGSIISL